MVTTCAPLFYKTGVVNGAVGSATTPVLATGFISVGVSTGVSSRCVTPVSPVAAVATVSVRMVVPPAILTECMCLVADTSLTAVLVSGPGRSAVGASSTSDTGPLAVAAGPPATGAAASVSHVHC